MRYARLENAVVNRDQAQVEAELAYFETVVRGASSTPPPRIKLMPGQLGLQVPILMYHRTPPDFEAQISHLVAHGYTGITLDKLADALTAGATLPAKPVVITLDDGYADQLQEIAILRKYHMPATLFMINGGERSNYCIGANRKPSIDCGEVYLSWDQLRAIDREGLITIGAHTVNHPNLPTLTPDMQRFEITESKRELEAQLGHAVRNFAYPYGSYNDTSIQLAREAGFRTAVTTMSGSMHSPTGLFTLQRLRDSLTLP